MSWFESYRAYDDETLIALANAGLLRRAAKDLEAGKISWIRQETASGVIEADGQQVQLDARGPQQALCDCPAPGICKHILGATLWLRSQEFATAVTVGDEADPLGTTQTPSAAKARALDEVLALDPAVLFKAAGMQAVRRAADTPVKVVTWQDQGALLVLELPELGVECRWITGAGFPGMVSEVATNERKAVHLLALVSLRREHGYATEWPAGVQPVQLTDSAVLGERERQFLAQVQAMLSELLSGGLAHVSSVTSARLLALNMSARGEGLPRLAALLRNLGGVVDLLVRRDHRAQERDALAFLARIHALCIALGHAQGNLATAMRGRLRRDFDETNTLDLLPLGAYWWETRGGARGITLALWDIAECRLLQASLARPAGSDTSFNRRGAWQTLAWWSGAGPVEHICEAPLQLTQPRMADDGRLAVGGATRAQVKAAWEADDVRLKSVGFDDWMQLAEQLRDATGLASSTLDLIALRPLSTRVPKLDEIQQRFNWSLQDAHGRWLTLAIPCGPEHRQRVENLDRLSARNPSVNLVLVHIDRSASATLLVPVAVTIASEDRKSMQTMSLDFVDERPRNSTWGGRIMRMFEMRRELPSPAASPSLVARLLSPVIEVIEMQAETGRMSLTHAQTESLHEALGRISSVGLDALSIALRRHMHEPAEASLLRLSWICQLTVEIEGLPFPE